jgi:hypothetical protein
MRSFCFLVLFFITSACCYAQGTSTGCLISSTKVVYISKENTLINDILKLLLGGNDSYRSTSGVPLSNNYCSWAPTPTGAINCGVCTSYVINILGVVTGCQTGAMLQGHVGTYTMVLCNLDDYTWTLGAATGIFGVFVIRRRNKL